MKKILFRADGNAKAGLGHIMRCMALAEMLGDAFERRFALAQPATEVRALIESRGIAVIPLQTNEVAEVRAFVSTDEVVVLDGYAFDTTYQQTLRGQVRKLVFIDDLVTGPQVADVIINQAGRITETDYRTEAYTQFCLGPQYALLRPEFLSPKGFGTTPADGPIFVNLGGVDAHNTSRTVLNVIRQADPALPVRIVLGPLHPDRASIEALQDQLPDLTILQSLNAEQMLTELQQCRLAITSCSTVAYEVCAVNRPLIAIVTANNQSRLAEFFVFEKLALSVLYPDVLQRLPDPDSFSKLLGTALAVPDLMPTYVDDTLINQRRYFDGRSPERLRTLFGQLFA